MFSINRQRPLATLAVIAGLLAVAAPASASNATGAVVAADFNYTEKARGSTVPLGTASLVSSTCPAAPAGGRAASAASAPVQAGCP